MESQRKRLGFRAFCQEGIVKDEDFVIPIFVGQILSDHAGTIHLDVGEALGNFLPDGANHIALLIGVDIRRALSEPVAQVLTHVPWDVELKRHIWDEHPEGVPRQLEEELFTPSKGHLKPLQGPVWRGRTRNESQVVLADRGDEKIDVLQVVDALKTSPESKQWRPPVQTCEGVFRADELLVCQASISRTRSV